MSRCAGHDLVSGRSCLPETYLDALELSPDLGVASASARAGSKPIEGGVGRPRGDACGGGGGESPSHVIALTTVSLIR